VRRLLVAVSIAVLLVGGTCLAASGSLARPTAAPAWVTTAKQRLENLDTKSSATMTGYAREKFGPAWFDVDLNGCSTRNDILARDLRQVVFESGDHCFVAKGTLEDRYTGTTINFVQGPGTSGKVQIDHVVALAAAWRTGAKQWTADTRLFYANDGLVLLAIDGPTNSAKGDKDAADWLPPNVGFRCRYVARQIAIKTKYELWVTPAERTTMSGQLAGC
jgi:hypothetical protein